MSWLLSAEVWLPRPCICLCSYSTICNWSCCSQSFPKYLMTVIPRGYFLWLHQYPKKTNYLLSVIGLGPQALLPDKSPFKISCTIQLLPKMALFRTASIACNCVSKASENLFSFSSCFFCYLPIFSKGQYAHYCPGTNVTHHVNHSCSFHFHTPHFPPLSSAYHYILSKSYFPDYDWSPLISSWMLSIWFQVWFILLGELIIKSSWTSHRCEAPCLWGSAI